MVIERKSELQEIFEAQDAILSILHRGQNDIGRVREAQNRPQLMH